MNHAKILNLWNIAAADAKLLWILYGETLLCAHGYNGFPEDLESLQLAVQADDRKQIRNVLRKLPQDWQYRRLKRKEAPGFRILHNRKTILTVYFLQNLSLTGQLSEIRCGDMVYPVHNTYRDYLAATYGDYENGLTDPIGVGLTVTEKEDLKKHQQKCIEALAFLQQLRGQYDLKYFLEAGSVLGAMRHQGMIPWDDDIDVGVCIEDLDRFERILRDNLPPEFTLEQPAADHPYPRMFSKICYQERCCIDIWPFVPTYTNGWKAQFVWWFGKIITKMHYRKIGYPVKRFGRVAAVLGAFLPDRKIMKLARWNERIFADKQAPAYVNLYSIYSRKKETLPREWFQEFQTGTFEGIPVPMVGCTEAYLNHLYGDYKKLPVPWKRASRHTERFHIPRKETAENQTIEKVR